jgi:hypothetical protein
VIAQGFCAPGERYIRICLRVWVITHWPMVIDCFLFRSVKHTHTHTHKHTTAEVFVCWLESGFSFCWISLLIIIWGLFGLENNQQKKKKDHLPPCCRWSILNSFFLFPFVRIRNRNKIWNPLFNNVCVFVLRTERAMRVKTVGNNKLCCISSQNK